MNLFRNLQEDEIEVRRARTFTNGKVELLLYKTARTDMNLLDETFGNFGWATQYKTENGILFCGVALKDEQGTWIWRWNAGAEQNFEKEKSTASDAFKRACFLFGLGRELYTSPKIIVQAENDYETFKVDKIGYDNKDRVSDLRIVNNRGKVVFDFKDGKVVPVRNETMGNLELLKVVCGELKHSEDNDRDELLRFYNFFADKVPEWEHCSEQTIRKKWEAWKERSQK